MIGRIFTTCATRGSITLNGTRRFLSAGDTIDQIEKLLSEDDKISEETKKKIANWKLNSTKKLLELSEDEYKRMRYDYESVERDLDFDINLQKIEETDEEYCQLKKAITERASKPSKNPKSVFYDINYYDFVVGDDSDEVKGRKD